MRLNKSRRDRAYLYGRLVATAEQAAKEADDRYDVVKKTRRRETLRGRHFGGNSREVRTGRLALARFVSGRGRVFRVERSGEGRSASARKQAVFNVRRRTRFGRRVSFGKGIFNGEETQ